MQARCSSPGQGCCNSQLEATWLYSTHGPNSVLLEKLMSGLQSSEQVLGSRRKDLAQEHLISWSSPSESPEELPSAQMAKHSLPSTTREAEIILLYSGNCSAWFPAPSPTHRGMEVTMMLLLPFLLLFLSFKRLINMIYSKRSQLFC